MKKYTWAEEVDKNKHKYVIGIDFGHGETSAAYCDIAWDKKEGTLSQVADIDMGHDEKKMPSAMTLLPDERVLIGNDAFQSRHLLRGNVKIGFKQKPENIHGTKEQLMIRFMHEVHTSICEKHPEWNGKHLVYIAVPSGWDEEAINLYGEMAREAGLPIAGIISESRAAFIHKQLDPNSGLANETEKGAVVFDMGSSTLDFTYISTHGSNVNLLDYGYNCGASKVEQIMYEDVREQNEDIIAFNIKYPKLENKLLFNARKAKEANYRFPKGPLLIKYLIADDCNDEQFERSIMKFEYQPGELNQRLEEKGYLGQIRNALSDFKENHISGKPIHVVFLTGGASRMDFITDLIQECWGIPSERIYRDNDPSLTISRGLTETARIDLQTKAPESFSKLLKDSKTIDIYTPFVNSLISKVQQEVLNTITSTVSRFKTSSTDASINDLQNSLKWNIESNLQQISVWATSCFQDALNKKTKDIQNLAREIVAKYSDQRVSMGKSQINIENIKINTDMISKQMDAITNLFKDNLMVDIVKRVGGGIAGSTIAYLAVLFVNIPFAILIAIVTGIAEWLLGKPKSEEEKRREALAKKLNKKDREKVYKEFNKGWSDLSTKTCSSISIAIRNNTSLRKMIQSKSQEIVENFVKDCMNQARILID